MNDTISSIDREHSSLISKNNSAKPILMYPKNVYSTKIIKTVKFRNVLQKPARIPEKKKIRK